MGALNCLGIAYKNQARCYRTTSEVYGDPEVIHNQKLTRETLIPLSIRHVTTRAKGGETLFFDYH